MILIPRIILWLATRPWVIIKWWFTECDWVEKSLYAVLALLAAGLITAVVGSIWFGWFSSSGCNYPYHEVYAGSVYVNTGKTQYWQDTYNCVHN